MSVLNPVTLSYTPYTTTLPVLPPITPYNSAWSLNTSNGSSYGTILGSSPAIWLDAADTSTIDPPATNTNINSWTNKGSFAGSAVKNGTGPTTLANRLNGLNVLTYGSGNSTKFTTAFTNQAKAVFFVAKITSELSTNSPAFTTFFSCLTLNFWAVSIFWNGTNYIASAGLNGGAVKIQATISNPKDVPAVYCFFNSATSANNAITINGTSQSLTTTAAASGYQLTSNDYLTQRDTYNSTVDIGEILVIDGEISSTQRQQIEGYLAWKWGLQGSLDASHPYKTINIYAQPQLAPINQAILPLPLSLNFSQFSPKQIASLLLWFDSSDQSSFTMDNTNKLLTITDKSGAGGTGAKNITFDGTTVTWSAGALNGYPTFNTTAGRFRGEFGVAMTNYYTHTAFIVTWLTTYPQAGRGYSCLTFGEDATNSTGTFYRALDTDQVEGVSGTNNFRTVAFFNGGQTPILMGAPQTTTPFLYNETYSSAGSLMTAYYNFDTTSTAVRSPPTLNTTASHFFVACGDATTNTWNGLISEILVYNSVLSEFDRIRIQGYLAWKWGLQNTLPASHPFKTYPPPP